MYQIGGKWYHHQNQSKEFGDKPTIEFEMTPEDRKIIDKLKEHTDYKTDEEVIVAALEMALASEKKGHS